MPSRSAVTLAAAVALHWLSTLAAVAWSRGESSLGEPFVLLNVAVLGPLALAAAYRLALVVGGARFGAWTLVVWVAGPWILVATALRSYDATARDAVLPLVLGLTTEPGFAAGTAAIVGVALLATPRTAFAAAGGVALGLAALLVPATLAFAVAAAVALLAVWRPRAAAALGAAVLPFAAAAALWRTSGTVDRSYDALVTALDGFREYFFSERVVEWLPLAGALGLGRRSLVAALAAGGGFVAFAVVQMSRADAGFENASVFVLLLPGLPAYALLAAAVPLLVPTLAARLRPATR